MGNSIEIHTCYGNRHQLIVEGRLLEQRTLKEEDLNDGFWRNGWRKLKQLVNNEIKNSPIVLRVAKEQFERHSDDEGYFEFHIEVKTNLEDQETIALELTERNSSQSCQLTLLSPSLKVGIISDFDDTLVVSNVTNKIMLIYNLLFENYKQRNEVKGMVEKIKTILAQNPSTRSVPFFVITGSPKQLYKSINRFLDHHDFPPRTLITKKIHGKNADSLFHQEAYKYQEIEQIILLYPHIRWVLFGDSGEKDREIYTAIAKQYPEHIEAIYIRDVEGGKLIKEQL